jgi:hypothetical protein
MDLRGEKHVSFTVMDEDTITDDMVGAGTLSISDVAQMGTYSGMVPLYYKGRNAGELHIEADFISSTPQTVYQTINPLITQVG